MTDKLVVYAYNVLFGDGILIEMPDGRSRRFILIDVGNATSGRGGENQPLLDAIKDVKERTGGKIDLYVMTHEHMDHVQGLLFAKEKDCELQIDTVWMPASSEPGYYERHPDAKKKRMELQHAVEAFEKLTGMSKLTENIKALLDINARKTDDCVDFIRKSGKKIHYLYQGCKLKGQHPFTNADFRILAPEEDTSVYYRSIPHFNLSVNEKPSASNKGLPLPLPGVDGGVFYELIGRMDSAFSESVFAIDQAGNDSSLVFELTWRGKRLLFTGDAEQKSWHKMDENTSLKPVDLFKIGHHGSCNAMPPLTIFDKILPKERQKQAVAVLSTYPDVLSQEPCVYSGVPDKKTLDTIKARTRKIYSTTDVADGKPVIVALAAVD